MTIQLDWPPDVVNCLTEEARQKGLSLEAYVLQSVLQQAGSNGTSSPDEDEKRSKREEAAANIRDIRRSVTLEPDLTIRDLINEGRRL